MAALRIFSYLPNPRIWKATITARLCGVEVEVRGASAGDLTQWLWDFDARPITDVAPDVLAAAEREGRIGFADQKLYKTDAFLEAQPFGTVPAAFSPDGHIGIFESNSIMRAVARLGAERFPIYGRSAYESSRIDGFLDASLVFARAPSWSVITSRSPTSASSPSYACFTTSAPANPCSKRRDSRFCSATNSPRFIRDRRVISGDSSHIRPSYLTSLVTSKRSRGAAPGSNSASSILSECKEKAMSIVTYEKDGAVGVVTLAKPPHNLIDEAFLDALLAAYGGAVAEGSRSILLRSSMRHFCAGADVNAFTSGGRRRDQKDFEELIDSLENVPLPVVAAVHGAALGGGFELALTCDVIIAANTAAFGMAEASLGLLPLLGGVQRVVQRAGPARAKEMAMFARRHDPAALERWGIINLVVPENELPTASMSWARQLAAGPTVALRGIKTLANLSARHGISGADAQQVDTNNQMWASKDQKRGLTAFLATGPGSAVFEGN
jgi:enoyl-CoA hydratase/carnithine racemase